MLYSFSVQNIYNKFYPEVNKVLCMETAAKRLGLSTSWGIPVCFFYDNGEVINSEYLMGIKVKSIDEIHQNVVDGAYCTTPEQTICDLFRFNGSIQSLNESLIKYYYINSGNIQPLLNLAKDFGIEDKLRNKLRSALKYYNE